jgi:hypothetical protein
MELPVNYTTLTPTERREVRNTYVEKQKGKCQFCQASLSESPSFEIRKLDINKNLFPENFFKYPVHLHHDHDSGLTIGAVHSYCNAVLWQYHGE